MTTKTKRIPAHRVAMIEAFEAAIKGKSAEASRKLAKSRQLTNKFYANK